MIYSNGQTTQASQLPSAVNWAGNSVKIGPFNLINGVLVVLALYLIVNYILLRTTWGRHIFAVGDDHEAARLAGIRTNLVLFGVYLFAGAIIAVAAWVSIGYTGAASPNNAVDANLQSITAVVIGGTSLFGGRGGVIGTLFGALIVVAFTAGLTLANVNDLYQPFAEGILVIIAVGVDQWIRRGRHERGTPNHPGRAGLGRRLDTRTRRAVAPRPATKGTRCSKPAAWSRRAATSSAWPRSMSASTPARCSGSSATTAPASRR